MPWFKTQTISLGGLENETTRPLSGSAPEILVRVYDKSSNNPIFVAFTGSIDGTYLSAALDPSPNVLSFNNAEGFGRLDAWPYINVANGVDNGSCKVDIHEWLEDENE